MCTNNYYAYESCICVDYKGESSQIEGRTKKQIRVVKNRNTNKSSSLPFFVLSLFKLNHNYTHREVGVTLEPMQNRTKSP